MLLKEDFSLLLCESYQINVINHDFNEKKNYDFFYLRFVRIVRVIDFISSNFDKERAQNSDAKCNVYSNQLDIIVMETITGAPS